MATAVRSLDQRPVLVSGGIAAVIAAALAVVVPIGGDAAAHLYRTLLVEHGALIWDNLWFAGQYPLASYSLLYYIPAAMLGNTVLAAVAVVASAVLFASLLLHMWGRVARLPAYAFALLAGGQFLTGDYPYTCGFAALLATLVALQRGRNGIAIVCAAVTLGCSPLAFFFLCLALTALFLRSSHPRWREVAVGVPIFALAGIEFAALALFPSPLLTGPFTVWRLVLGVPVGLLGVALSLCSRAGRPLASIFGVWTVATIAGYFVSSPVGHNVLRPEALVFPLMLLAALLAGCRPRWLAALALTAALAANVGPYTTTALARTDQAAKASFWTPLLGYVARHATPDYRLEVVPTINHWEAYYVPKASFAIARGWYQQLDNGDNPGLYRHPLVAASYRAWLRRVGVRFVVLARTTPAAEGSAERSLLLSGRSGLRKVFSSRSGSVYELPAATPLLTGPAPAAVTALTLTAITGWVARPGRYLLRIHFTPYWRLAAGSICIRRGPDGMTTVEARRRGTFSLRADESATAVISSLVDPGDAKSLVCGR